MLNKRLLTLLVFFVFCSFSFSQKIIQAGIEHNFVHYGTEEGLPIKDIFKTYESSKGYIWICGRNGISKFDGINFETFTEKDGLPNSVVRSVCEDNNGIIWFGTNKGIAYLKDSKINTVDTALRIPSNIIMSVTKLKDGTLWLSEANHVVHLNPNNLKNPLIKIYQPSEKIKDRFIFRDIWQNKKGDIIAGCDKGCFYLRNDSLVRYNNMTSAAYQMVEFEDGTEWFNAWNEPIRTFKNKKATGQIDLGSGTLGMIKDFKGNVWIVTWDRGIYKYDGVNMINFSAKEGLSFNTFWGVNQDSNGNIWFSGWGAGLFKYSGECFTRITDKSGLPSLNLNVMTEDLNGLIWIATDQSVTYYNQQTKEIKSFTECNGKKLAQIVKLFVHPKTNEIWCMGYLGKGYKINNNKITEIDSLAGHAVDMDKDGNIWIGTDDRGLLKISGKEITRYDQKKIHGYSRIPSLFRDNKNNLWIINLSGGIDLFYNNDIINLNEKNGFFKEVAETITQDESGNYWSIIAKRGIYKYSFGTNNTFKILDSITEKDGIKIEEINSLLISKGIIYIGSSNGLLTYKIENKPGVKKTLRFFGKDDGLLDLNCMVFFADKTNKIWLNTSKGVYCFNPEKYVYNKTQNKTYISKIKLFFETPDWSKYNLKLDENNLPLNLTLPYNKNNITFSFIGINFVAPSKVLYQYKLQGLDEDWSPIADRREANYTSIPPGTYTFMVKSCNNEGIWNDTPTTYIFTITPPFWKTIWFYFLSAVLFFLILYTFIKYREKQLTKEKNALEEKISERTFQLKGAFKEIEEKNKEITDSLNYASKIQAALLPAAKDIELLAADSFILFKPKDIVSGDFYWTTSVGSSEMGVQSNSELQTTNPELRTNTSELFYLAVCDSTGHGVPGAFMSLLNISFLNEALKEHHIRKPNEIFNYIRERLTNSISKEGQKDGFDGVLICYNSTTNIITYAAGNNKPILISNNKLSPLANDKMPIGKGEKTESFTLQQINHQKGDSLYLFTDGFVDQFGGPKGKKFKYKQLEDLLLSIHQLPFNQQKEIIDKKFLEWKGNLEQIDDVCLIGIKL